MNYPIWRLDWLGGGTLIAIISIVHVYVAHFAVGGGLFIWLADRAAYREGSAEPESYLRRFTRFFLLLTLVFGAVTGVGIWFAIGLVSPAATSTLIHGFVFAWAAEWFCFLGEIVALLIYHYYFDTLERRNRMMVAFFYFMFAFLSLVIVNGVLSFMLTPGGWNETKGFWDGFLNPGFLPSMVFRASAAVMFAGIFGFLTTAFTAEGGFRARMLRRFTVWLLVALPGILIFGLWYYLSVPEEARFVGLWINPSSAVYLNTLIAATVLIYAGGLYLSLGARPRLQRITSCALVTIGLFWMGGYEYLREIARKPYAIQGHMYSNSILASDLPLLRKEGVLAHARWSPLRNITRENRLEAGRELYTILCSPCHTIGGMRNDILPRTGDLSYRGMLAQLTGMGRYKSYMPEFAGIEQEKEALASFIVERLHGKRSGDEIPPVRIRPLKEEAIPAWSEATSGYVLLAWSESGMSRVSDCDSYFSLLPPGVTLHAILIKRGAAPGLVSDGVTIRYRIETAHANPSRHSSLWRFAESLFKKKLAANTGIAGKGTSGEFSYNEKTNAFTAAMIPVLPYADGGSYNPYPLAAIEAYDAGTEKLIASTKLVAPATTEMGCHRCHGGEPRNKNNTGIGDETARNILARHDRSHATSLLRRARSGSPARCQSCHADTAVKGASGHLNLSAAVHGLHAHSITERGERACMLCHPSDPAGPTRFHRGVHSLAGLSCVDCHGTMSDHALALLAAEKGKRRAALMAKKLTPVLVTKTSEISPRTPHVNMPDCLSCHEDYKKPHKGASAFNRWTKEAAELYKARTDNIGVRCGACHGAVHAEYPARNPYQARRDVIQPLQYMRAPYAIAAERRCAVCHREGKRDEAHHENMLRAPRRRGL